MEAWEKGRKSQEQTSKRTNGEGGESKDKGGYLVSPAQVSSQK